MSESRAPFAVGFSPLSLLFGAEGKDPAPSGGWEGKSRDQRQVGSPGRERKRLGDVLMWNLEVISLARAGRKRIWGMGGDGAAIGQRRKEEGRSRPNPRFGPELGGRRDGIKAGKAEREARDPGVAANNQIPPKRRF